MHVVRAVGLVRYTRGTMSTIAGVLVSVERAQTLQQGGGAADAARRLQRF